MKYNRPKRNNTQMAFTLPWPQPEQKMTDETNILIKNHILSFLYML